MNNYKELDKKIRIMLSNMSKEEIHIFYWFRKLPEYRKELGITRKEYEKIKYCGFCAVRMGLYVEFLIEVMKVIEQHQDRSHIVYNKPSQSFSKLFGEFTQQQALAAADSEGMNIDLYGGKLNVTIRRHPLIEQAFIIDVAQK